MKKFFSRKGFTLVEVIVSFSLVLLVMIGASGTMIYFAKREKIENRYSSALNEIDNLRVCVTAPDYAKAVEFLYGKEGIEDGTTQIFYFDEDNNYCDNENDAFWRIEVTVTKLTPNQRTYFATAKLEQGGSVIYEMPTSYTAFVE